MTTLRMSVFLLLAVLTAQGCGNKTENSPKEKANNPAPDAPKPPAPKPDDPKPITPKIEPPKNDKPVGSIAATLDGHKMSVDLLAFSGDSKTLATYADRLAGTEDHTIFLWDVASKTKKKTLFGYFGSYGSSARGLALTNDAKVAFVAPGDAVVRLDATTDKITKEFKAGVNSSTYVAIANDGKLVAGSNGKKVLL